MFYIKAKIIKINENEIILESNNIGYLGIIIDKIDLIQNKIYKLYFINLKTDYIDQYLFFTEIRNYLLAKTLLEIKNLGFKTILNIFKNHDSIKLIEYAKNNDLELMIKNTNLNHNIAQQIIIKIRAKYLHQKYTKIQLNVIEALHKLGYKISDIYKAILNIDANLDQETLLRNTILKLNEIYK